MNTSNRKNIAILSFALVVVMLGFGMVIPIFPFFIGFLVSLVWVAQAEISNREAVRPGTVRNRNPG